MILITELVLKAVVSISSNVVRSQAPQGVSRTCSILEARPEDNACAVKQAVWRGVGGMKSCSGDSGATVSL